MKTSIIPEQYRSNLSARRLILSVAEKQKREGLYVGHYTRELSELTGIQPADDRVYGDPIMYAPSEELATYDLSDPY